MKAALIYARCGYTNFPPMGLLYLAACARERRHEIRVYDPLREDSAFFDDIAAWSPDVVGVSLLTPEIDRAREIVATLRTRLGRNVIYCCGGAQATAEPEYTLKYLGADFAVLGEGEMIFTDVCDALQRGEDYRSIAGLAVLDGDRVTHTGPAGYIENLDVLPLPARDLVDFEWYLSPPGFIRGRLLKRPVTLFTSRGCPSRCTFCNTPRLFGKRHRQRSAANVVAELQMLVADYGIDGFWFADDTFTARSEWVLEFCSQLLKTGIRLPWGCNSKIGAIREEMLDPMKAAGCVQIDFGVESGSDDVLKRLKKGQTAEAIKRTFSLVHGHGLRAMANLMLNTPEETADDVRRTERLLDEIRPDFVNISFTTPFPGSRLYDDAISSGAVTREELVASGWDVSKPVARLSTLSPEELTRARKRLANKWMLKNIGSYLGSAWFLLFVVLRTVVREPLGALRVLGVSLARGDAAYAVNQMKVIYRRRARLAARSQSTTPGN